mmetsp:Transcript_17636/g.30400  ORF Transcript_17636/g.30400 Transcript_17636/m.30400 type:complete len:132 (-) Transcript_17636:51-446(-)
MSQKDTQLYFKRKKDTIYIGFGVADMDLVIDISGAFDLEPDQLGRIAGERSILYFAEDGSDTPDIHGRDSSGKYFTIVRGNDCPTETTGPCLFMKHFSLIKTYFRFGAQMVRLVMGRMLTLNIIDNFVISI